MNALLPPGARREWSATLAILMQPVHQRRAQGSLWLSWMLIGFMALGSSAAFSSSQKAWLLFGACTGLPLALLIMLWWILLFTSLVNQCHPAAMRLQPRMRARAMRAMAGAWIVSVLLMTLFFGVPSGYPGRVALATGLLLVEFPVMFSALRVGGVFALVWLLRHSGASIAAWFDAAIASDAAVALGVALLAYEGRVALRRMFGTSRLRQLWRVDDHPAVSLMARMNALFARIDGDQTRGQPLFLRVLGTSAFAGKRLMLVYIATACLALRGWDAVAGTSNAHDSLQFMRAFLLIMMLGVGQAVTFGWVKAAYRRQHEQALVRLSPGAPRAADLNRAIARYMLTGFLSQWCWLSVLTLCALYALGANAAELRCAAAVCAIALPLAGVPLRDYAGPEQESRSGSVAAMVYPIVQTCVALAAIYRPWNTADAIWLAIGAVAVAALFTWQRWREMLDAAPAFPAGRLA